MTETASVAGVSFACKQLYVCSQVAAHAYILKQSSETTATMVAVVRTLLIVGHIWNVLCRRDKTIVRIEGFNSVIITLFTC